MATPSNTHQKSIEFDEVNIFSIDKSVYDWFNTKHGTNIQGRKVPVLFGGWERFAQMQDNKQDDNLTKENGDWKISDSEVREHDDFTLTQKEK